MQAPTPGDDVVVRDQQGGSFRSRVVGAAAARLTLSAPDGWPKQTPLANLTRLLVTWPHDRALWVLPVVLAEIACRDGAEQWTVEIDGDAWREERRRFARTTLPARLAIRFDDVTLPGELVDLSEVALRCVLDHEHRQRYQPQAPVTALLELSGEQFEFDGRVLLAKATARADLRIEVVVLFDRPVKRQDALRKHLSDAG